MVQKYRDHKLNSIDENLNHEPGQSEVPSFVPLIIPVAPEKSVTWEATPRVSVPDANYASAGESENQW